MNGLTALPFLILCFFDMNNSVKENLIKDKLIVFIDNDQNFLKDCERNLSKEYNFQSFIDRSEALQFIQENHKQIMIVVSNYMMPGMNGIDFFEEIHKTNNEIVRIMLIDSDLETAINIAIESNVFHFSTKPVKTELIEKMILDGVNQCSLVYEVKRLSEKLKEADTRLTDLAQTDSLTSLKNRRAFIETMRREWSRSKRYHTPLSFMMIDIDHFKKINETYGRSIGDTVMKKIAALIRAESRETDCPARYGDEEFCILLPGIISDQAINLASRIKEAVHLLKFKADSKEFNVTVSLGISEMKKEFKTFDQFIEAADRALHKAKQCGKNCIVFD